MSFHGTSTLLGQVFSEKDVKLLVDQVALTFRGSSEERLGRYTAGEAELG